MNYIFIQIFLEKIFEMATLLELSLKGCPNLEILSNIIKHLISLKIFNLKYYKKLRILPNSLRSFYHVKNLNMYGYKLILLLIEVENFTSLIILNIK